VSTALAIDPAAEPVATPCVVVVTGAAALPAAAVAAIPPEAVVIAADGALDHALAAGLTPAGLVGDLDSVTKAGLEWARAHATIDRHPVDKDRTDTELALRTAADLNPDRLIMIGAGDRLDHQLAAIGALGQPSLTHVPIIEGWWGAQHLRVIHGPGQGGVEMAVGTTVSLLALHGPCEGVSISGVRWPLTNADLAPLVGHGVSNVATAERVDVRVSTGVLTVIVNEGVESPSSQRGAGKKQRRSVRPKGGGR
jgi:thiamine pyrophosphokinase